MSTIKIYGRVRPGKQSQQYDSTPASRQSWYETTPGTIAFHVPRDLASGLVNNSREGFDFQFDRVFDTTTTQEEVFDVVAKPVVDSVMQGYNGTLFAYGQTG